ncbi:hypothetical protein E2C01_018429 [Portunus trituberculatus]|uniref:Uncharacterized protein n=1 Tax=Portunus trituberculatus TaxID=210409 RepID=A0A5B7DX00_PORTR|nr:hypothetical protein [Portunus trituberculatus]
MTSMVGFKVVTVPDAKEPTTSNFVGAAKIMFPVPELICAGEGRQQNTWNQVLGKENWHSKEPPKQPHQAHAPQCSKPQRPPSLSQYAGTTDMETANMEGKVMGALSHIPRYSLHKKVCTKLDCKYPHIKGNKRNQPAQEVPQQPNRHHPGPHTREELAENNNRLATRRQGGDASITSQQDQLQKMLACLMNKIETPEPKGKRCCSSH